MTDDKIDENDYVLPLKPTKRFTLPFSEILKDDDGSHAGEAFTTFARRDVKQRKDRTP